jgi:hypothetical protein
MIEFTNEDLMTRRAAIVEALKDKTCEVTFTKVDGSLREMPCTLDTRQMPPPAVKEHHQTRLFKPEVLSVWCTDKQAWRSFRVENVVRVRDISGE